MRPSRRWFAFALALLPGLGQAEEPDPLTRSARGTPRNRQGGGTRGVRPNQDGDAPPAPSATRPPPAPTAPPAPRD
jgi:hypothetical protein